MASVKPNYDKTGKVIVSYRFRCCTGRDEFGKQQFATKTVEPPTDLTPAKALKKMQNEADSWEKKIKTGKISGKKKTFRQFYEDDFYTLHLQSEQVSPGTREFYANLKDRIMGYFGNKPLDSITASDVKKFLLKMESETYTDKRGNEKKYSDTYIRHHKTVLNTCFNFAVGYGFIEENPMTVNEKVKKELEVKHDKHDVDFLREEEARIFLTKLEEADLFWQAVIYTLIYLGIRRCELVALQWKDFDFENNLVHIERDIINCRETGYQNFVKDTKTLESNRVLPMIPVLAAKLKAWKNEQKSRYGNILPSAYVFNNLNDPYAAIRPHTVTQWLSRFNKRYNLHNVSPHDLRHTCGTLMSANRTPIKVISKFLGHSDSRVTEKYYLGSDVDMLRKASAQYAETISEQSEGSLPEAK